MDKQQEIQNNATVKKGGRPLKIVKRSRVCMIRLTALEEFAIAGKARNAGVTISDFFRRSAQKAKVVARLTLEEIALYRIITGMANNLNQLTHLAHKDGLLSVQRNCRNLLEELDIALNELKSRDRESDNR